jgi:parallel beta-helix repeat protein
MSEQGAPSEINTLSITNRFDRNTIYVDDDAPSEWYDATHVRTIQEGVNNASNGDTIYVFSGFYYEQVVVDKTVDLIGENKNATTIDAGGGSESSVYITADGVSISGFTVRNLGGDSGIEIVASYCTVSNNIVTQGGWWAGIDIWSYYGDVHDNIVSNNTVTYNGWAGIQLSGFSGRSYNNTISNNIIANNSAGIKAARDYDSVIFGNILTNNTYGYYSGEPGVRGIKILQNTITNNQYGMWVDFWSYFDEGIISNNTITGNEYGIICSTPMDCTTISNNIIDNEHTGIGFYSWSNSNTIINNTISNHIYGSGIYLSGSCNNIVKNRIVQNTYGIYLAPQSTGNSVSANTIIDSGYYGMYIGFYWEWPSHDNKIYHNNFVNTNNSYDECIEANSWYNTTLFEGNYWNDYAGDDADGDDIGDTPYDIPGGAGNDEYPLMYPWSDTNVFVDDDQTPGWYDATHVATIQEAVTVVPEGSAVYVYNGIYQENVVVDKEITLIGQHKENVVIDGGGSGDVVSVTADGVFMKGLTMQNSGLQNGDSGLEVTSGYSTIYYNIIMNNNYGIHLMGSSYSTIRRTEMLSNNYGIWMDDLSTNNSVYHNHFNNVQNAHDEGVDNKWNDEYPSCGNYWDDYMGNDDYYGPNQDVPGSDGIGDTPYAISGGDHHDQYPLMSPWNGTSPVPPLEVAFIDDDFDETTIGWGYQYFDAIQDGIDAVIPGGTVHVANGRYYEHVAIDKTIHLIGEDRLNTIIDGSGMGEILYIAADDVSIRGFMICNGSTVSAIAGIYTYYYSDRLTISDNIITTNYWGLQLHRSHESTISNNIITANYNVGVYLKYSYNNFIYGNQIIDNHRGINFDRSSGNTLYCNLITNNDEYAVYTHYSSDNLIYHNDFSNNLVHAHYENVNFWDDNYPTGGNYWDNYTGVDADGDGIGDTPYNIPGGSNQDRYPLMYPGIVFVDDDQTTGWYDATHVRTIQEGIQNATTGQRVFVNDGIYYEQVIIDKPIYLIGENMERVVVDGGEDDDVFIITSNHVRISRFAIHNSSSGAGIRIHSNNTFIYGNNIEGMEVGIWISSSSTNNVVFHNNFLDNTQHAYDESGNTWDNGYPSSGNYWDDYTGGDIYNGPNQDVPGSDSVGDTPYPIPGDSSQDQYPLMYPWNGTSLVPTPLYAVYVDDDFDENTHNWGYDHFNTITDGINAVTSGGMVYVANGTYYENIIITKLLNLQGEDRNATIIDGGGTGDVVYLSSAANWVNISGFTIRNSGGEYPNSGIYLYYTDYVTLSGNTITDNFYGLYLKGSHDITISENLISGNTILGINLDHTENNQISSNNISNSQLGIDQDRSHGINIFNNIITSITDDGISMYKSTNSISGNLFSYCNVGVDLWYSSDNTIFSNTFTNCGNGLHLYDSSENIIYHNNFISNTQHVVISYCTNLWDNGYPSGGNYWDNHPNPHDNYCGENQDIPCTGDGIIDLGPPSGGLNPYTITVGEQDTYPLLHPCTFICGDCNNDGGVNIGDVVYLINYLFKGGPAPILLESGDVNADGILNVGDVVYLLNYLFRGGPPPQ